jgi:hypothetical protein
MRITFSTELAYPTTSSNESSTTYTASHAPLSCTGYAPLSYTGSLLTTYTASHAHSPAPTMPRSLTLDPYSPALVPTPPGLAPAASVHDEQCTMEFATPLSNDEDHVDTYHEDGPLHYRTMDNILTISRPWTSNA